MSIVIDVLREYVQPRSILEIGCNGIPLSSDSHTMDISDRHYPQGLTYLHNAAKLPWPIGDKVYDVVVALQVFEHLDDSRVKQTSIFREATRVANSVVLSLPYKWRPDKRLTSKGLFDIHAGIDDDLVINRWASGIPPDIQTVVGDNLKRKIYVWKTINKDLREPTL
jgi:hypothetical protein